MLKRHVKRSLLCLIASIVLWAQIALIVPVNQVAEAAQNGLAQKPLMGWSSYSLQVYDGPGNWTSAEKIKKQSDAMKKTLQPFGYEYINIDAGWNGDMDEYARPIPNENLYPNGFQEVIDYVHNNGQKIGVYFIPGVSKHVYYDESIKVYGHPECSVKDTVYLDANKKPVIMDLWDSYTYKMDFSNPCSQKYIDSIGDLLGGWGIDFVKFDSVTPGSGENNLDRDAREDVKAWHTALSRHNIWLELSWAVDPNYADWWRKYSNGWRIHWDVEAYSHEKGMVEWANIARLFPMTAIYWREAGPGGWNDFDSLNVGNGKTSGLTKDERRTATTFWAVSAAQFYIGDDISNLDDLGLELLTNPEVIAVNQAGMPARPVSMATDQQVWYSNNGDGTFNVALFNLSSKEASVTVNWSDIGLDGSASVRDLWSRQELGTFQTGFTDAKIEPHASRLFKVTAKGGKATVNNDNTGLRYSWEKQGDTYVEHWVRNDDNEKAAASQKLEVTLSDTSAAGALASREQAVNENADSSNVVNEDPSYQILINDTNPNIQYSNGWNHNGNRSFGNHNRDVHFTDGSGNYFTYTFKGTGIEYVTEEDRGVSKFQVYIDDVDQGEFTTNNPEKQNIPMKVGFAIADLPDGVHTIKVVNNENKYLLLDALRVTTSSLLGTPSANSFDKNDPKDIKIPLPFASESLVSIKNGTKTLTKNTDYTLQDSEVALKSNYFMQQDALQPVNLTFEFAEGATQSLSIAIIGTSISPTDLSFDKASWNQTDLAVNLLLTGDDSLTGIKKGTSPLVNDTDYQIADNIVTISKNYLATLPLGLNELSFEFKNRTPLPLKITVTNSAAPGRYAMVNNTDSSISFSGKWFYNGGRSGNYEKDVHWTETQGSSYSYRFKGTGIDVITEKDKGMGKLEVFIDGQSKGIIDPSDPNASNEPMYTAFSISGLPYGKHTIKVVSLEKARFAVLDAFRIHLPSLLEETIVKYDKASNEGFNVSFIEDIDLLTKVNNGSQVLVEGTDYTIAGNQVKILPSYLNSQPNGKLNLTFNFAGDYFDDVHETSKKGAYFEYTFKGNGIELLFPTGPKQGKMDIYMDGVLKQTVDAHSEKRTLTKSLFSINGLSNGFHTLKVVNASDALMLVDKLIFNTPKPQLPGADNGGNNGGGGFGGGGNDSSSIVKRNKQSDGSYKDEVGLTENIVKSLIAKQAGSKSLVVDIPDEKDEASLTSIAIDKEAVKQLTQSNLDLVLNTANAAIMIPNTSLKNVNEAVTFKVVPVKSEERIKEIAQRANAKSFSADAWNGAEVVLNGRPVDIETNLQNHEVKLVLPLQDEKPSQADSKRLGAYIEHSDGTKERTKGSLTTHGSRSAVQIDTTKFSTFVPVKSKSISPDHTGPYIQGFQGELFKPSKVMTRAEIATILSRIFNGESGNSTNSYSDVKSGYWAEKAIHQATELGLMKGFSNGTFKPEQPITRAEMAALISRAMNLSESGKGFKDIAGTWAEKEIKAVQSAGYINGYQDGTFRPNQSLTRAEAVAIINRVIGLKVADVDQSPWKDVPVSHWAARDIIAASLKP
ncbi:X2-like carbohydrate binding domain-containing protein [Paenibacillus sp. GCM10012307]|uniref:Alpha-galactosidase n=1 Tax=Paenibacillus roseus TaxID=2798579 RepID=A0A934MPD2_9BACL|nr:X2-like carbohydrate binding domain-containing protein [Paenibacillus roseus]MBJ6360758.1 S-layer homology domain-containing protein [Paenibacillus roseus]